MASLSMARMQPIAGVTTVMLLPLGPISVSRLLKIRPWRLSLRLRSVCQKLTSGLPTNLSHAESSGEFYVCTGI